MAVPVVQGRRQVMPFKSAAQRRWMHANHPEMAERWEEHTPAGAKLPEKVRKKGKSKKRRSVANAKLFKRRKRATLNAVRNGEPPTVANAKKPNPLRIDPTRTLTLRESFAAGIRRKFRLLKGRIVRLVAVEDCFGIKDRQPQTVAEAALSANCESGGVVVEDDGVTHFPPWDSQREDGGWVVNAFCPTGEGGGIDPSCDSEGKGKGTSASGIVKGVLHRASQVEFSDERVQEPTPEVDEGDHDAIAREMTEEEDREMNDELERIRDITIGEYMDQQDPPEIDETSLHYDVGWQGTDVADKMRELIEEHVGSEDEQETLMKRVDEWNADNCKEGEAACRSLNSEIRNDLPDEARTAFDDWWETKSKQLEIAKQDAQQEAEDETRRQMENDYDDPEDRQEYLRRFFRDHQDRFNKSDEDAPLNTWMKDSSGDSVLMFETSGGNRYNCNVFNRSVAGRSVPEFSFADASGRFSVTGAGQAREVFSKATAAVVSWMQHNDPEALTFSAAERSRQGLYDKLVKTVAKVLPGYSALVAESAAGDYRRYVCVKREKRDETLALMEQHKTAGVKTDILVNFRSVTPEVQEQWFVANVDVPPILDWVADVRQRDDYSCGASETLAVTKGLGVGPGTLDEMKDLLGTSEEYSTDPRRIVAYLRSLGLAVEPQHGMTVDDLEECVRHDMAVIVCVQDYFQQDADPYKTGSAINGYLTSSDHPDRGKIMEMASTILKEYLARKEDAGGKEGSRS